MGFQLKVHFTGLCLFVPDEIGSSGRGTMHVLMPPTGAASTYGVMEHLVRLYPQASGSGGPDPAVYRDMKGWGLQLGGAGGSAATNVHKIVGLRQHTQKPVPRRHLGPQTSGGGAFHKPAARVTLGSGSITYHDPGAQWMLGGIHVCLPYRTTWTIDVPQNQVDLVLHDLIDSSLKKTDGQLGPSDAEIWIYHAMPEDMPPHNPQPTEQPPSAEHFKAFYELFDAPANTPIPYKDDVNCKLPLAFPADPDRHGDPHEEFVPTGRDGASPFTCMSASGPPG